jgi:hypothetical protein
MVFTGRTASDIEVGSPPAGNGLSLLLLFALPVFFVSLGANSIWDANGAFCVETPVR